MYKLSICIISIISVILTNTNGIEGVTLDKFLRKGKVNEPDEPAREEEKKTTCGKLKLPPHAKAANFKDGRDTFYNEATKKTEPVFFYSGDVVELKCEPGFTLTGAKDGPVKFTTECSEAGYYKPSDACREASKCGALPEFDFAHPTGEVEKRVGMPNRIHFTCDEGYSLDGEKVIPGGLGKNQFFSIDCEETGTFTKFEGKCQAYAFVASTEVIQTYNKVFEVLWGLECKNIMTEHDKLPAAMETVCADTFTDSKEKATCDKLITQAKTDIIGLKTASDEEDAEQKNKESFEERDANAKKFCDAFYKLHVFKSGDGQTESDAGPRF